MSKPKWSTNITDHFEHWVEMLHTNQKCPADRCSCHKSAFDLMEHRIKSIEKGMPDYGFDDWQIISGIAFDIHEVDCEQKNQVGWASNVISPPWTNPVSYTCNCYTRAVEKFEKYRNVEKKIEQKIEEDLFDYYERIV